MKSLSLYVVFALAAISFVFAEDIDDPLSDEFIEIINKKATTWKVIFSHYIFGLEEKKCERKKIVLPRLDEISLRQYRRLIFAA